MPGNDSLESGLGAPDFCLFFGRVEFPGFAENLDDTIGKAIEKAACGIVFNAAAVHFQ